MMKLSEQKTIVAVELCYLIHQVAAPSSGAQGEICCAVHHLLSGDSQCNAIVWRAKWHMNCSRQQCIVGWFMIIVLCSVVSDLLSDFQVFCAGLQVEFSI